MAKRFLHISASDKLCSLNSSTLLLSMHILWFCPDGHSVFQIHTCLGYSFYLQCIPSPLPTITLCKHVCMHAWENTHTHSHTRFCLKILLIFQGILLNRDILWKAFLVSPGQNSMLPYVVPRASWVHPRCHICHSILGGCVCGFCHLTVSQLGGTDWAEIILLVLPPSYTPQGLRQGLKHGRPSVHVLTEWHIYL